MGHAGASEMVFLPDGVQFEDWPESVRAALGKRHFVPHSAVHTQWRRLHHARLNNDTWVGRCEGPLGALAEGLYALPEALPDSDALLAEFLKKNSPDDTSKTADWSLGSRLQAHASLANASQKDALQSSSSRGNASARNASEATQTRVDSLLTTGLFRQDSVFCRCDPVSLRIDARSAVVLDARAFELDAETAHALHAALMPVFAERDLTLHAPDPTRWYLQGAALAEPRFARAELIPLDEMAGCEAHLGLPAGAEGAAWRRLVNDVQMTLHAHPVNAARVAAGALPVNSVWPWGLGHWAEIAPAMQVRRNSDPPTGTQHAPDPAAGALVAPAARPEFAGLAAQRGQPFIGLAQGVEGLAEAFPDRLPKACWAVCLPAAPLEALAENLLAWLATATPINAVEGIYLPGRGLLGRLRDAFWRQA